MWFVSDMPVGLTLNQILVLEILLGVLCQLGVKGLMRKDALEAAKVRPKMFTTIVKLLRKLKKN